MERINEFSSLGKLIRDTRKAQGLTQEQLAAVCGVGVRFLREVEHGKPSSQIGKVFDVLSMLGIELVAGARGEFD